jgi:hypothetical protein
LLNGIAENQRINIIAAAELSAKWNQKQNYQYSSEAKSIALEHVGEVEFL